MIQDTSTPAVGKRKEFEGIAVRDTVVVPREVLDGCSDDVGCFYVNGDCLDPIVQDGDLAIVDLRKPLPADGAVMMFHPTLFTRELMVKLCRVGSDRCYRLETSKGGSVQVAQHPRLCRPGHGGAPW